MKAFRIVLPLLLCAAPALAALEIRSYDVRLTATEAGSARGTATIVFGGRHRGSLSAPLGIEATDISITSAPPGTRLMSERFNGQTRLLFHMPLATSGETRVQLAFNVANVFTKPAPPAGQKSVLPEGSRMLNHRLVNTEAATIARYVLEVMLPAEVRPHSVVEALPKPGKKEAEPRVQLASSGGLPRVRLQVSNLRQGDATSTQIEIVPAARSPFWLIAGIVLSVLYLVYFRDLVAARPGDGAAGGGIARSGE